MQALFSGAHSVKFGPVHVVRSLIPRMPFLLLALFPKLTYLYRVWQLVLEASAGLSVGLYDVTLLCAGFGLGDTHRRRTQRK